jgi:hypothetical protein
MISRRDFFRFTLAAAGAQFVSSCVWRSESTSAHADISADHSAGRKAEIDTIAARKAEFIRFNALDLTPNDGVGSKAQRAVRGLGANYWNALFYVIPQLEFEKQHPRAITKLSGVTEYIWPRSMDFINRYADCSDFVMNAALRILYLYPDSPLLGEQKLADLKNAVLNFVYWYDETKQHNGVMMTENHQFIFSTAELLAGQLYPDELFPALGDNGKARIARATPRVLRWLDWRVRFGFSEWLSNHYFEENFIALFNLAQFAENAEVKQKAENLLHLMMFEMAANSLDGNFNPTQGRVYSVGVIKPSRSVTAPVRWMMFNQGSYQDVISMSGISLATSPYEVPKIVYDIAHDDAEIENIQRNSFNLDEVRALGIDINDPANFGLFTGSSNADHPAYAAVAAQFLPPASKYATEAANRAKMAAKTNAKPYDPLTSEFALTRVQPYTYRTPDYMLSCAQDWRKGLPGYQQHVWTAVLGGEAQVYTTILHPDKSFRVDRWAGNGVLPKAVAYRNVLISICRVPEGARAQRASHAWFPQFAFDEVAEENGWIFGRKNNGFVALHSLQPAQWLAPDLDYLKRVWLDNSDGKPFDYFADGAENVWICELGNVAKNGSFEKFKSAIAGAKIEGDTQKISYVSPTLGVVETGWDLPLTVAGKAIELRPEKRLQNPYCTAEFNTRRYAIKFDKQALNLSFEPAPAQS